MQKLRLQIPERRRQLKSFSGYEVVCSTPVKGSRVITFGDTKGSSILETLKILALPFYDSVQGKFLPTCFTKRPIDNEYVFHQIQKELGKDVVCIDQSFSVMRTHTRGDQLTNPSLVSNSYASPLPIDNIAFKYFSADDEGLFADLETEEAFIFNYVPLSRYSVLRKQNLEFKHNRDIHINRLSRYRKRQSVITFGDIYLIPPAVHIHMSLPVIGNTLASLSRANRFLNMVESSKYRGFTKLSTADKKDNLSKRVSKLLIKYGTQIQNELDKISLSKSASGYYRPTRVTTEETTHVKVAVSPGDLKTQDKTDFEATLSKGNLLQKALVNKLDLDLKFGAKVSEEDKDFVKTWLTLLLVRKVFHGTCEVKYANSSIARYEYDYDKSNYMLPMEDVGKYIATVDMTVLNKPTFNDVAGPKTKKKAPKTTALDIESQNIYDTLISSSSDTVEDILKALKNHVK